MMWQSFSVFGSLSVVADENPALIVWAPLSKISVFGASLPDDSLLAAEEPLRAIGTAMKSFIVLTWSCEFVIFSRC